MFDDLDLTRLRERPGVKWSATADGTLPAWVADMDFEPPAAVREVLHREIDRDLGYPHWDDHPDANPVKTAFADRMHRQYGLSFAPSEMRIFTELIQALQAVLHVATKPGDAVAMHVPAYPPFLQTLVDMGRRLVPIPMVDDGTGWVFDTPDLSDCRALILVDPHNPTGRSFRPEELAALADLAERHDLLVISDEIHSDLLYEPYRHTPFATLAPARTVTLSSASKAFNLAGLRCSVAHIGDRRVRTELEALPPLLLGEASSLSVLATVAAWQFGGEWLAEVRQVLDRNRRIVADGLPKGVHLHLPEATYLAWLDLRDLGLGADPAVFFEEKAAVRLSHGPDFGPGGDGFARLNFATSGPILEEILRRLRSAV